MLVPILLFIVGLVLLIKGGDWFVDGATGLAHRFHVPEILIGATVVSIGTTLPEVMVSATSAVSGHGEIAYGNAIGSVICNTALIAALTIAIRPSEADRRSLRTPVIFFFIAAVFYAAIAYTNGAFTRLAGIVLLVMFAVYMVLTVRQSFRDTVQAGGADEAIDGTPSMGKDILLLVIGAAFIAVGVFLSSVTENQLIAAVSSITVIGLLILISFLADQIPVVWVRTVIDWFSVMSRYAPFTNGLLDISAIIYYVSFAAVFLFLTVRVYEKRRWS